MDERAEGYWWVRLKSLIGSARPRPWRLLWSYGDSLMSHDPRDGGTFVAMKELAHEWGPYLGKEPETIESLDRKIADMMAAKLPRFEPFESGKAILAGVEAYDPSTDYEGEDTRALDGAGVPSVLTMDGQDDLALRSLLRTPFVGTRSIITPSQELLDALSEEPKP
jgi:hypothetical protein